MRYLFYTEGYSEFNLVNFGLKYRGIDFTEDFNEARTKGGIQFLKNCRGDSGILPALEKDFWWLNKLEKNTSTVIVIQDIPKSCCYKNFKNNFIRNVLTMPLKLEVKIINSRPKIEAEYLLNEEHLKNIIYKYIKEEKLGNLRDPAQIKDIDLIKKDKTGNALVHILKVNGVSFSKTRFSNLYFSILFNMGLEIPISKRLGNFLDSL